MRGEDKKQELPPAQKKKRGRVNRPREPPGGLFIKTKQKKEVKNKIQKITGTLILPGEEKERKCSKEVRIRIHSLKPMTS